MTIEFDNILEKYSKRCVIAFEKDYNELFRKAINSNSFSISFDEATINQKVYTDNINNYLVNFLVNGFISDLFKSYGYCVSFACNSTICSVYNSILYDMNEIENKYGYQIKISKNNKDTYIRFTNPINNKEITENINKSNIVNIVRYTQNIKTDNTYSIIDFFKIFLPEEIDNIEELNNSFCLYENLVIERCKEITESYSVSQLCSTYLLKFRCDSKSKYIDNIYKMLSYRNVIETKNNSLERNSLLFLKAYNLREMFINNHLYNVIFGKNNIYRCFITSEYLYSNFLDYNSFDYTSIVSGYIKSVELLLRYIIVNFYSGSSMAEWNGQGGEIDTIHQIIKDSIITTNNNNEKILKIRICKENEPYLKLTLEYMIEFINNQKNNMLNFDNSKYKSIFIKILKNYKKECRNGFFHTDIVNKMGLVETIRNNTIFVHIILLTCCNIDSNILSEAFNIIDDSFEYLYRSLIKLETNDISFETFDNKLFQAKYNCLFAPSNTIDEYGLLNDDAQIDFEINDSNNYDHHTNPKEYIENRELITFDHYYLPKNVYKENHEEKTIIYPVSHDSKFIDLDFLYSLL